MNSEELQYSQSQEQERTTCEVLFTTLVQVIGVQTLTWVAFCLMQFPIGEASASQPRSSLE
jgi:hypothetical protein